MKGKERKQMIIEQVVENAISGDRDAFNLIIREYQQQIFTYIFKMIKNYQDAEDLTQDTFVKAYKKISNLNDTRGLKNWLYQIAYRTTVDYIRKPSVKSLVLLFDPSSSNEVSYEADFFINEDSELVNKIFANLNYKELTLLTLRVIEEMSYSEIGVIMNKSPSVLRKRYERLIAKLKKELLNGEGFIYEEK